MKKKYLIFNIIIVVSITVLYIIHFSSPPHNFNKTTRDGQFRVAFIDIDSLILNYNFAQDLQRDISKKQEGYNQEFRKSKLDFEKDWAGFLEKVNSGGFPSQKAALRERERLAALEQDVQRMRQEMLSELSNDQANSNKMIQDSIEKYIDTFNDQSAFHYILSSSVVLKGEDKCNITKDVLNLLNSRYKEE